MLSRRDLVAAAAFLPLSEMALAANNRERSIARIEKRAGGRLGVTALDTGTGKRIAWRGDERFAMCSTFKALAVSAVLRRVDRGKEHLDRWIKYGPADLLSYAPITRAHVGDGGMHLVDLAAAAIEWSDNTAANLLLASLGGPPAVTAFARSLGDSATRLDRYEEALNTAIPGDPRDTTSPNAMLRDWNELVLGNVLGRESRARLTSWLIACKTAAARIPAGLPAGWVSGNKTGSGQNHTANNVAVIWPPRRKPILLAVYFTGSALSGDALDAVVADVARTICGSLA